MHLPALPTELVPFFNFIVSNITIVASLVTILIVFIEYRRFNNERNQEEREKGNLGVERRRLTEVNIKVKNKLNVTNLQKTTIDEYPFTVFYLQLKNEGDGPVDIWASLVSSRVLSSTQKPGIGKRSRDVEWSDYKKFFWNESTTQDIFAGTSTTKNMVADIGHFVRLSSNEESTLRRIDGINNPPTLSAQSPITVMYRVFVVARGYPLGEILRQLGGGPPDPLQNVNKNQLQFRTIAQPTYARWRSVQQALLNLNRVSFRIATGESDPLGRLIEPDAWRFFLLSHEDFTDPATMQALKDSASKVLEQYPDYILGDNFQQDPNFKVLQSQCETLLSDMIAKWKKLLLVIKECQNYQINYQNMPYETITIANRLKLPTGKMKRNLHETIPNEGYPMRIWVDEEYQAKWLKYMEEGYIISRPFPRQERSWYTLYIKKRPIKQISADDIPADPRVLEPFVMRSHYFLETIDSSPKADDQQSDAPDSNSETQKR